MKNLKLILLSLLALVFGRPLGFCTANTQAEDIAALQARLDANEKELEDLRAAQNIPASAQGEVPTAIAQLCKGAGVDRRGRALADAGRPRNGGRRSSGHAPEGERRIARLRRQEVQVATK